MKYAVVDPIQLATSLAHEKLVSELVSEHGDSAVLKETDLYKKDGEYKTWVMDYFTEYYEYYFKMITNSHNEKLLKKCQEDLK